MRAWLMLLTVIGLLALVSMRVMAAPFHVPTADRPLVRECEAFYGTEWEDDGGGYISAEKREDEREDRAERILAQMQRRPLVQRLEADLPHLPPSTLAYASVVYTLGYFGIDPAENIKRLDHITYLNTTPFPVAASVPVRMDTIYRNHPSQATLAAYMTAHEDGEFQEELSSVQGPVFVSHPRAVLQIAVKNAAVRREITDVFSEECTGEDADTIRRPILADLRRLRHDKDRQVEAVARECLQAIVTESQ